MKRRPLLRFLAVGVALFAWTRTLGSADPEPPFSPGTVVSDDELLFRVALARGFAETDAVVRRRLALNMRFAGGDGGRDENALVEEALALGMQESDVVVRRRLARRMRGVLGHDAWRRVPSEAELSAYLEAHRERWTEPARVRIAQLFFRDRAAAERARAALPAGAAPAGSIGDPLPVPGELPSLAEPELAAQLGAELARAAFALEAGAWSEPLPSPYGFHLVWVHERVAARLSPLAVVHGEVREALRADETEAAVRAGISELRERYQLPAPEGAQ